MTGKGTMYTQIFMCIERGMSDEKCRCFLFSFFPHTIPVKSTRMVTHMNSLMKLKRQFILVNSSKKTFF